METEQTFTRGPILSTLLKFALPVLLALLLQAMYGAVDPAGVWANSALRRTSRPSPPAARSCQTVDHRHHRSGYGYHGPAGTEDR